MVDLTLAQWLRRPRADSQEVERLIKQAVEQWPELAQPLTPKSLGYKINPMDEKVRQYLKSIGRKGGSVSSEAKRKAARANAKKRRNGLNQRLKRPTNERNIQEAEIVKFLPKGKA
jgi:hypothetical protein